MLAVAFASAGCAGESAEGRPWVHELRFRNVRQVKESDLRDRIAIEASSSLWWVPYVPRHYLDPFTLQTDRERIEAYYRAHGRFSARVVSAEARPHRSDSVDVTIVVEEGEPTRIAEVAVTGLEALAADGREVSAHLAIRRGQVFDHPRYLAERDGMLARLRALGYAWATVEGRITVDRARRTAAIRWVARPGRRVSFGATRVKGAGAVDERAIVRRAGIVAGTRYDPALVDEARARVEALRLFSSVTTEIAPARDRPDVAEVILTVKESPFRELRLGGGIGIEPQRMDVHAQAIHTWRNFAGGMRTLQLRGEAGYVALPNFFTVKQRGPVGTVELQLTQPDVPFRLSSLSATAAFDLGIEYGYQFYGPRAQLGVTQSLWRDRVRLAVSYNFQLLGFFSADPTLTGAPIDLTDPKSAGRLYGFVNPYRLGWWQENLALDLRDRALDPRLGVYLALVAEEGGAYAGGAFQYEKLLPEARAYLPLGPRVVLAGRVQYGRMFVHGDLGSPITRRFYLGGPSSHRGFSYNRLSAQVPSGNDGVSPIPIGGDQLFLAQAEVRAELFQIAGIWIAVVAFLDLGDVAEPTCSGGSCPLPPGSATARAAIDLGHLHAAVGGGLRVKTPIGTIRFDLGQRLNRLAPSDPDPGAPRAYHISIGEAF